MRKNPALSKAFHRMALGFLLENIAFCLRFVPGIQVVEPIILLIGAMLMMSGFYLAAREVSGFKNPLILKMIVFSILLIRAAVFYIFGRTFGLDVFIIAEVILDLFALRYVCDAVTALFPAISSRTASSVWTWNVLFSISFACLLLLMEVQLSNTFVMAVFLLFLISAAVSRVKYYLYLKAAAQTA